MKHLLLLCLVLGGCQSPSEKDCNEIIHNAYKKIQVLESESKYLRDQYLADKDKIRVCEDERLKQQQGNPEAPSGFVTPPPGEKFTYIFPDFNKQLCQEWCRSHPEVEAQSASVCGDGLLLNDL